jgi:hypothetical protein
MSEYLDEAMSLSYKKRLIGFGIFLACGIFFTALSTLLLPMIVIKPHKFAVAYSLGNHILKSQYILTSCRVNILGTDFGEFLSDNVLMLTRTFFVRIFFSGNLLMMTSTVFLVGPTQQCKNMWTGLSIPHPPPASPAPTPPKLPFCSVVCTERDRGVGGGKRGGGQRGGRGSGEGKEGEVSGVGGDGGSCLVGGRALGREADCIGSLSLLYFLFFCLLQDIERWHREPILGA